MKIYKICTPKNIFAVIAKDKKQAIKIVIHEYFEDDPEIEIGDMDIEVSDIKEGLLIHGEADLEADELSMTPTTRQPIKNFIHKEIESARQEERERIAKLAQDTLTVDVTKMEWVEGYAGWPKGIEPCLECQNGDKISKFIRLLTPPNTK